MVGAVVTNDDRENELIACIRCNEIGSKQSIIYDIPWTERHVGQWGRL